MNTISLTFTLHFTLSLYDTVSTDVINYSGYGLTTYFFTQTDKSILTADLVLDGEIMCVGNKTSLTYEIDMHIYWEYIFWASCDPLHVKEVVS